MIRRATAAGVTATILLSVMGLSDANAGRRTITLNSSVSSFSTEPCPGFRVEGENKCVYPFTGQDETFLALPSMGRITIKAWGAGGNGNYYNTSTGGAGGFIKGELPIGSLQTFTVKVGGSHPVAVIFGSPGGGYSAVQRGGADLIIAGGGGGAGGGHGGQSGGAGGGPSGQSGAGVSGQAYGGAPGTQTGPGAGRWASNKWGGSGAFRQGGNGVGSLTPGGWPGGGAGGGQAGVFWGGGGGGGGYYGGASGGDAGNYYGSGGGGGSSYAAAEIQDSVYENGNLAAPGGSSDPDYVAGTAVGGSNSTGEIGGAGMIVISW